MKQFKSVTFVFVWLIMASVGYAQKARPLTDVERLNADIAFVNGSKEKMLQNYDEALKQFKACYLLMPENAALNFVIGETFYLKKQYEEAERYVLRATILEKENFWYKELLADVYMANRKTRDAAEILLEIGKGKKDVDYLMKSAYLYSMIREYKSAIKVLDEAEKKVGINEDVITRKEQIYLAQNKLDKAIGEINKLIKAFPNDPKFKGMLADLYWANGKADKAVAIYQDILKSYPNNGFALFAMADYYKSIKEYDKWYDHLKKGMVSTDVESKLKVQVLSGFVGGKEFTDQSEKLYELATLFSQTHPNDPMPYLVLGDVYQQQRKFDLARTSYRKALEIEPSTYIAWQQTVFASSQLQNNELLLKDCEDAISYFPNEPVFFMYAAVASMQLKQYEKAVTLAQQGLDVITPDQEDLIIQLNSTLADAFHYAKKYAQSDSVYEQVLKKDPKNAYALNNYAYFLSLRKDKLDEAEAMSKKSIALDPENPSYLDTYGWILFVKGDYQKAKEYIEKSLVASPNNAEVIEHLGDVLYKLNEPEKAIEQWKKAKELGSEGEKLEQKIKDGKWYE